MTALVHQNTGGPTGKKGTVMFKQQQNKHGLSQLNIDSGRNSL
jgi:hypothetical protein